MELDINSIKTRVSEFLWYKKTSCTKVNQILKLNYYFLVLCKVSSGSCEQAVCHCDAKAAKCFKRSKWNKRYRNYKWKGGRC